jgi:hypothetical protein
MEIFMARLARLDIPLPTEQRAELDAMASATGLTSTGLARLAIIRMLNDPGSLTGRKEREAVAA